MPTGQFDPGGETVLEPVGPGGSFGLPKFLPVMVDRQQQADNDGDHYGLTANLLGGQAEVITGGVSRRKCSCDRRGDGQ